MSSKNKEKEDMKKTLAVALLAIIAMSSLSFAITSATAMGPPSHGWGWNMGAWKKNGETIPFQRSWVRLNGIVNETEILGISQKYPEVNGSLSVNARTVGTDEDYRKIAFATAIWSNTTKFRENGNFSYNFYAAKLVEANVSTLKEEGADFFLNGTWNIVNVTITRTVIKTGDAESGYTVDRNMITDVDPVLDLKEAYGELNVTSNWTEFTLTIGDVTLNGTIGRTRMTQMTFCQFKVSEDDTEKVSRVDLKVLAKNFGARPGWGAYDSNMDFNCNYKIDIADLATVAANVESA